jgi:hypothetical protein
VTPEADERCSSDPSALAQDEDCDGQIDEGCPCLAGAKCYTGSPPSTEGTGPCHAGQQACSDTPHACMGEVTPTDEDCSNPGRDDDCDGVMDDIPTLGDSCAGTPDAKGVCKAGAVWQCAAGKLTCVDAPAASAETCDGLDDDCDGRIDEGFALDSDANNCGTCGHVCGAGLVCCAGECADITSSNLNCSACGKACGAGKTCCSSACFDTTSDVNHCGDCTTQCPGVVPSCSKSTCSKPVLGL